ncbi:MAG: MogA/MoaB family molybdenum cofactor biosynthesis protein [Dehalococcoidia bacterium]|nr:MogA/MoaB family molybdenum cofactor biosynthesis protein [Dehalococcoidia bacterium]
MLRVAILTISDAVSKGIRQDASGDAIERMVRESGAAIAERALVPDEREQIAARLRGWADAGTIDLVLTTGGTGLAPRDVTPEATRDVIEKEAPGIAEWMRMESARRNSHAVLSRAVAGSRRTTLMVNLPGSPKGVEEMLALVLPVLPHALEILQGRGQDHTPPAAGHDHEKRKHEERGHEREGPGHEDRGQGRHG